MAEIRDYTSGDIEAVVEIFRSNIPKYFSDHEELELRSYLADYPENYYLVEVGDEVVGAGGVALNEDDTVSLCWGMVRHDHLGTGLGKLLTEYRIERSNKVFGQKALVTSTSHLTEGFYNRYGFVTTERTFDGFRPGLDICKMRREY
ncbi:MAG TPA: GNAT family N-acetyltransferase [Pyrinomonadaceae bacterium]|nr:GNAT family N-acetyltransferase [Pyrinomonadaceae bacterium]